MNDTILRFAQLHQRVRLSRSTVWRLERAGQFPKRRSLGGGIVGWLNSEVSEWIASRTAATPCKEDPK